MQFMVDCAVVLNHRVELGVSQRNLRIQKYRGSDFDIVDRVTEIAEQRGVKAAQVALAWILSKPAVSAPIIGASKPYQLEDAIAALSLKLTEEEITRLEDPYEPHPILGHSY